MDFLDLFKPYSPELRGSLEEYLRGHDGPNASNSFEGSKYYFVMKESGLMIPETTFLRVGNHPGPDIRYFVNSDYLLESHGEGEYNMSCIGAKKGVYDPKRVLKNKIWSIHRLNLELL